MVGASSYPPPTAPASVVVRLAKRGVLIFSLPKWQHRDRYSGDGRRMHLGVCMFYAHEWCASYGARMATERVNLSIEAGALAAARRAADDDGVSLSAWLSRAAWNQAIEHAARISAEQDRHLAAEFADYDAEREELMFRREAA